MGAPLCVTSVFYFVFFSHLLSSAVSLKSPEIFTFSNNQTLVSPQKVFELGLLKPSESISRWYLGIWFKDDQKRTSVWVANRDNPLTKPVGTLKFSDNNLQLLDENNVQVWSTNLTGGGVRSQMIAELLDNGNFVMKDSNDPEGYLWQSFDSPTDTLLPEMKLGTDPKTGIRRLLNSWESLDNPAEGFFFLGIEEDLIGSFAIFLWDETLINNPYRADVWNGYRFGDMPPVLQQDDSKNRLFEMTKNQSKYLRLTLGPNGFYELYTWIPEAMEWEKSWSMLEDICSVRMSKPCGSYSYCSKTNMSSLCTCIQGFNQMSGESNGYRHQCVRKTSLNCRLDRFLKLQNMKLPDHGIQSVSGPGIDLKFCKRQCLVNCHCMAFALVENRKDHHDCMTWNGDLDDMRNYTYGGQDLFVRLADDQTKNDGKSKGMAPWVTGLIVGAIVTGFFVIGFFSFYCWKKHKGRTEESTRRDIIMNELVGPVERFQYLEFRVVAEATNHFSDTNILGQGGFGTVYKGRLPDGSEVAIKRLANTSSQGMREFKNEIRTILNILHLNLVRLLGCCCEGEEIILIYEFLENGSLNQYIFDENRSQFLNWATRHEIIKGIAEGLMYLHSYTNPPIIHRDLKPSNILLGKDMIPKISDFGLAKILRSDNREAENDTAAGTRGYMSEEHALHMEISERSDIFSFGVTVLEIITGERNLDYCNSHTGDSLLDKAWRYWNDGNGLQLVDSSFVDSSLIEEEVLRSIQVGLLCVQPHVDDRPSTKSVVLMLQSPQTEIPKPRIPNYFYARLFRDVTASSSSVRQSSTVNYDTLSRLNTW